MGKRGRRGRRRREAAGPQVHVQVASADSDLRAAAALVKPAILYADRVTIYSPIASMVTSVAELAAVSNPQKQAVVMLEIIRDVPALAAQLNADEAKIEQLRAFLALDPRIMKAATRITGGRRELDQLYSHLDGMNRIWREEMPKAIENIAASTGAGELLTAIEAGAVTVADVTTASTSDLIANCVRTATGGGAERDSDDLVENYMAKIIEILIEADSFPLLDSQSWSLARGLEEAAGLSSSDVAMRRSAEVSAAAHFMGYLPYFPDLPMDEVLDLRRELRSPLVRFRAAMIGLSNHFSLRPIDEDFSDEVADAWRSTVDPALAEIRELLAQHGLLREVASIALGDPKRLIAEAGGVLVAAERDIISLSGLVAMGVAAAIPSADVVGRAVRNVRGSRADVRQHSFYFLHHLGTEAERRTRN